MNNRHTLVKLLLISLALAVTLAGCTRPVSNGTEDSNHTSLAEKEVLPKQTPPQYYFINGFLLGSWDDSGWHSLCAVVNSSAKDAADFYAEDLLNQECYYVYQDNQRLGVSNQIIWLTGEALGLGSFGAEDAPAKFARYGEPYQLEGDSSSDRRIFSLPVKLGEELSQLKIPDYAFQTEFVFGENWKRHDTGTQIVTNSDAELFPRKLDNEAEPTSQGRQALTNLLQSNNMENTVINFTECVQGDWNNDGNEECLMLANNPKSEMGYPLLDGNGQTDHLGIYSVMLYQEDDGSVHTLYSDLRLYQGNFEPGQDGQMELMGPDYCARIDLLSAADLNSDGVYEILARKGEWEWGFYLVYAVDSKGEYNAVLRSNYGI